MKEPLPLPISWATINCQVCNKYVQSSPLVYFPQCRYMAHIRCLALGGYGRIKCPLCNIEERKLQATRSHETPLKRMSREEISDMIIEIDNKRRIEAIQRGVLCLNESNTWRENLSLRDKSLMSNIDSASNKTLNSNEIISYIYMLLAMFLLH